MSLNEHLMSLNADLLKALARQLDLPMTGLTRKEQLVEAVRRCVAADLPGVVARLTDAERHYLAESVARGELIGAREFQARYGVACPRVSTHVSWNAKDVAVLTLFVHVPRLRYELDYGLVPELVQPLEVLLPKPAPLQAKVESSLPSTFHFKHRWREEEEDRPIQVFESERLAPAELSRVLRLIQGGKVKVTDAGRRPTDASSRLLSEVLVVPDFALDPPPKQRDRWTELAGPVRGHAWGVLVQQCGWAKARGGVLTLTAAGQSCSAGFNLEQLRVGVERYFDNDDFDELNRINHIRGQGGKGQRSMSHPSTRKQAVQSALQEFPVGQWLSLAEARRLIDASGSDWNVLDSERIGLYFGELQYGFISDTGDLNSQFLRALFLESLATLGLLDVAYVYPHRLWPEFGGHWGTDELSFCGRYDGLLYARLNPLGAYALGFTDRYDLRAEEAPKLFRVLPNHDFVLVEGPLNPADRAMLELLASPKSDLVWTLDADRMLTHVEGGGAFQELRDFLEANAAEGLPETVRVFLAGLESRLGACPTRREAVILEWSDEALAHLIATSAGTHKLCFHAGGNRLVVPADNLAAFSRALKRLGYVLPRGK